MRPGTRAYAQIVAAFGREILQPDGYLDRPKLGALVFADEARRRTLNAIVHPAVRRAMAWQVAKCWLRGERVCVLDVPLLIESGIWLWVGKVVVVYWCASPSRRWTLRPRTRSRSALHRSSTEIQLQRLMQRDSSTREAASARLGAQLPIADKLAYADHVLDNSGGPRELEQQVDAFVRRLQRDVGWAWRVNWLVPPLGLLAGLSVLLWRRVRRARKSGRRRAAS